MIYTCHRGFVVHILSCGTAGVLLSVAALQCCFVCLACGVKQNGWT